MRADRLALPTRTGRVWLWQIHSYKGLRRTRCFRRFCGRLRFAVKALERAWRCVLSLRQEQGMRVIAVSSGSLWES